MHHSRNFLGKKLLELSLARVLTMLSYRSLDSFPVEQCENLYVSLGILVGHVQPELVELVRRSSLRVEPDVTFLGLAEFLAVGLSDERAGQCISVSFA